jgi:septal ring factor EnvC (AmiA/AmiB activator)
MKNHFWLFLLLSSITSHTFAQSDVFVCVNDNGTREYKNTGATKGCKRVDLQGISMIPSPYKKPMVQTASMVRPAASPADFPRVDGTVQRARDNDRLQILSEEMKTEERKLTDLKKTYNSGQPERNGDERNYAKYQDRVATMKEDVNRTEKNIEALRREIGNLK